MLEPHYRLATVCQGKSKQGPLQTPLWLSEMLAISPTGWMKSSLPARLFLSVDPLPAPEPRVEQAAARCFWEPELPVCRDFSWSLQSPGILARVCGPLRDAWVLRQGCVGLGAGARGDDCQRETGNLTPLVPSVSIFSVHTSACAIYICISVSIYTHTHTCGGRDNVHFSAHL